MIPIFRAFSEAFDKYIVGVPYFSDGRYYMLVDDCNKNNNIGSGSYPINKSTLSIHFPDMIDSQGNKIFASLQEDGKGGDLVVSKSYPFYGDAPEIRDSSGKCEELNYKGLLLFGLNGCLIDFVKVSDRVRGSAVGYIVEDFNEYKIVGVQE